LCASKARPVVAPLVFVLVPVRLRSRAGARARGAKSALDISCSADTVPESSLPNEPMEFPKAEIEALWCPWRVEYFELEKRNPNFLSEAAQASDDAVHLVLTRRKNVFLMMNRYPYAVGH